jgi:hypothetical protein
MNNRKPDVKSPITGYLAMCIDLINEADTDTGTYLAEHHALGYLKALYDVGRILPATATKHREEIEQVTQARLDALAKAAREG